VVLRARAREILSDASSGSEALSTGALRKLALY